MSASAPLIQARGIYKSFAKKSVLNGLDFTVEKGESVVIIGRSGCGKSVFLKHLIGLVRPDSGQILIDGTDIANLPFKELSKIRMRFSMLFQSAALFDSLSVGENVGFMLYEHTHLPESEIRKRVEDALETVGLQGAADLRPSELSGGMRKRAGLARAICLKPEVVLYDEPTTGLDPIMSDAINDLIIDLNKRLNITSVIVTHDMRSAYKIATRIAMMHDGKMIYNGTPDQVRETDNAYVKQFISGSASGPIRDITARTE